MEKVTKEKYRRYLEKQLAILTELPEDCHITAETLEIMNQIRCLMKDLYLLDDSMNKQFSDTGKE